MPRASLAVFLLAGVVHVLAHTDRACGAQMVAELRPDRIYFGMQTLLVVVVDDAPTTAWPEVKPVDGLRISHYGAPGLMQDLFRGTVRRQYRFLIEPARPGTFTIPEVTLVLGTATLKQGPFMLRVLDAGFACRAARIEPDEILVGQTAELAIEYEGVRPGIEPTVPAIEGLTIRSAGPPRVGVTRDEGLPVSTYTFHVTARKLGTYVIDGIAVDRVKAGPVTLTVSPFVIVRTQIGEASLVVGGRTTVHLIVRGLPPSAKISLVGPPALRIAPSPNVYTGPPGTTVFSFDIVAKEPGSFSLETVELPDGGKARLKEPIAISVRQAGAGGILTCRGTPRSTETVVGEPFLVDFEVIFRGDLRDQLVDLSQAAFAGREYVRVEPVNDPVYPNWQGRPLPARLGKEQMMVYSGTGEFNGQKEQMLRFTLKITPLATGELSLEGIRVVLLLMVTEEQRTAFSVFSSTRSEQVACTPETPPHRVVDPPGITAPPLYRGAVGRFTFVTELDRTSCTAMSPLTLTMKITGDGVGPHFVPPPLAEVPELTRDFDVSQTTSGGEVRDKTITFTRVIRPKHEGVREVPALPLVCYDYTKKKYETVYSLPIPIHVSPGSMVGAAAMNLAAVPTTATAPAEPSSSAAEPLPFLGANHTDLGRIVADGPIGAVPMTAILVGGPVLVALVWLGDGAYRRRRPQWETHKRRRAIAASLDRLDQAPNVYEALATALQDYLRVALDLPSGELSADVLAKAFDRRAIPGRLSAEVQDLLAAFDAGRFASGSATDQDRDRLVRRTRDLFREIDRLV